MTEVDPVRLPSRLAARFRLLGVIGRGAGSVVHRAHDDLLDRAAVIKIVSVVPHSRRDLGRFAALDHPHLVPVIDVELDEHADGGPRAVIVTDPSGGGDLRSRIARGPLDLVDALVCAAAVADALDHAHRAGVAHLAVAPGNVLFDEDGRARLADTGLAAVTARSSAGFLAPEQEGEDEKSAGSPADVHALGLVLVASLTGRPDGPDGPDGPDAERPEQVPDALRGVVDRMLAPDPAARPLAGEVTVALRRAALAVDPAASASRRRIRPDDRAPRSGAPEPAARATGSAPRRRGRGHGPARRQRGARLDVARRGDRLRHTTRRLRGARPERPRPSRTDRSRGSGRRRRRGRRGFDPAERGRAPGRDRRSRRGHGARLATVGGTGRRRLAVLDPPLVDPPLLGASGRREHIDLHDDKLPHRGPDRAEHRDAVDQRRPVPRPARSAARRRAIGTVSAGAGRGCSIRRGSPGRGRPRCRAGRRRPRSAPWRRRRSTRGRGTSRPAPPRP